MNEISVFRFIWWQPTVIFVRVTNGAIVIHTQRLKSDPGGNLLS
ncbi:chemotaxis protein [Escherichia coli]|nr:chemotaxis protein [Escherichia coli]TDH48141.1 chemotaxis protein [Escherichia coli]